MKSTKETDIRVTVPNNVAQVIDKLIEAGYYSSRADFARRSIIDKLIGDFELGLKELEPNLLDEGFSI